MASKLHGKNSCVKDAYDKGLRTSELGRNLLTMEGQSWSQMESGVV